MKKLFVILLFSLMLIPEAFAHPHIFIDLCVEIEIDDHGISGFWENWTIMGEFGENIGIKYDENKDGSFNAEETDKLRQELFNNIRKYNYYTYIETGGLPSFPAK